MNLKRIFSLLKETFSEWSEDKAPRLAAALAYYTVFSLAPLLVIVIAVAGLVFGQEAAQNQIVGEISGLVGQETATTLQDMIAGASQQGGSLIATIVGVVILLFGASGVFGQLQEALNTMWEVQPKPGLGIMATIKKRFFSFTMVMGVAFLLLVSLVVSAALGAVNDYVLNLFPGFEILVNILNLVVSFAIITVLFAMIFKYVPDAEIAWRDVWLGAAVTAFFFSVGRFLITLYMDRSDFASTYGAAGSLIVILLWVYYSAQILFFGAEFTQVYANRVGSRVKPDEDAIPVTEEARRQQGIPHKETEAAMAGVAAAASTGERPAERPAPTPAPAVQPGFRTAAPSALAARTNVAYPPSVRQEWENLLPEAMPSMIVLSAILAALVGFAGGLFVRRGSKAEEVSVQQVERTAAQAAARQVRRARRKGLDWVEQIRSLLVKGG